MKKLKIKIITGFRLDQHYTIDAEEAHKAYYLFLNPKERGIFKNGVALIGAHIQGIEPDYNSTMGWNPDHVLTADDLNQIREQGVDGLLRDALYAAKEAATTGLFPQLSSKNEKKDENRKLLNAQTALCNLCDKKGYTIIQKGNDRVAKYCECRTLKISNSPVPTATLPYSDH